MAEKPHSQDPFHHIFGHRDSAHDSSSDVAGGKRELSRRERREAAERAAERADAERVGNDGASSERVGNDGVKTEHAANTEPADAPATPPAAGSATETTAARGRADDIVRAGRSRRSDADERRARAEAQAAERAAAERAAAANAAPVSARRAAQGDLPPVTPTATKGPKGSLHHDPADADWLRVITGAVDTSSDNAHAGDGAPSNDGGSPGGTAATSRADRRRDTSLEYPTQEKKSRKGLIAGIVIAVVIALVIGGGVYAWNSIVPGISAMFSTQEPEDYEGSGSGEVMITIISGDTGLDIAKTLEKEGVVASQDAFYQLLLAQADAPSFQPGSYALAKKMSAAAALKALEDPASKQANGFVIPEGTALKDVFDLISSGTGVSVDDLNAAAEDTASFGLPAEAKNLEGFVFPATYEFEPNTSAHDILKTLVDRMFQALDSAGVAPENRWKTVVLAALVQREAGLAEDYPKVARVFLNRSDPALWPSGLLQSDATVAYGTGNTHLVTTTDEERADASNPYNTYVHPGMVVGPISNPGDIAIEAAVNPAEGSWLYFVTWNLDTGETVFSNTLEEHEAGVRKWQQWMKDNPSDG